MRAALGFAHRLYRLGSETLFGWVVVAVVLSIGAVSRVASRNDLRGLHEAGDSAGDALQARLGLANFWFPTGHHTDVGVAHPGPFALWVKAAAELLSPVTGLSVLGMTLVLFTALKVLFTVIGAAGVASFTRKPVAGLVFCITVLSGGWVAQFDAVAVGLQSLPIWPFIALVPAAVALARGDLRFLPLTLFVAGAAMHIHTVSAPAGGAVFLYGVWKLLQRRRARDTRWWSSLGIAAVFSVPLLARVVTEPGWPLSYREAAGNRVDSIQMGNVERPRFQLLADRLDVGVGVVFPTLLAAVVTAVVIMSISRRWREAMIPVLIVAGWAAAVAWLSPPDQQYGTELYWISGWWASMAGLGAASLSVLMFFLIPKSLSKGASAGALLVAALVTFSVAPPLFEQKISGTVGIDGTHIPALIDAIVENADGRLVAVGIENRWLEVEMGLVLELDRLNIPHCLALGTVFNEDQMALFFNPDRYCATLTGEELLVGSVREPSDRLAEVWYTQEFRTDTGAMHPYFSFGIPACSPRNDQGLPYPRCTNTPPNPADSAVSNGTSPSSLQEPGGINPRMLPSEPVLPR
jgi:hypothetical protein